MPPDHRAYLQWKGERFLRWEGLISQHTAAVVWAFLSAHKIRVAGIQVLHGPAEAGRSLFLSASGECLPERKLDREQILRLASFAYLREAHNIVILGPTGAGKTYLACALGMAASRSFYSVRYVRLPDLLVEIFVAPANGTYRDYMKKFRKEKLLILDEWLLYPLKEAEAGDVLELVEARNKVVSTIFCSQYDTSEWQENLYDPTLADAICDWSIYNTYTIQIKGESMRKRKGLPE